MINRSSNRLNRQRLLIQKFVNDELIKAGKSLRWLKYTKKGGHGYHLLALKPAQFEILDRMTNLFVQKHSGFTRGQVAEEISIVVNELDSHSSS